MGLNINNTIERQDCHSWVSGCARAVAGHKFTSIIPGTGEILGVVDDADADLATEALGSARSAGHAWASLHASERKNVLLAFADLIAANARKLALLEALEVGRPIGLAEELIAQAAPNLVRDNVFAMDRVQGDVTQADAKCLTVSWRRPRGVVLAITPWNFPVMNVIVRIAPALAAGNAVVLKPSEYSPRSAVLLAQLAEAAGAPKGLINVVVGTGAGAGQRLASHPGVDLIAFTGSTLTGQRISSTSALASLKPTLMECGGKSPQILMDDIYEDFSIWTSIFASAFWNTGQWCMAKTRVLVPAARLEETLSGLAAAAAAWKIGDPLDGGTSLGPLANQVQYDKYLDYKRLAQQEGAFIELPCPEASLNPRGYYARPAVVTGVSASSRIVNEEIFGPIVVVQTYRDLAEAVELANGTPFGLSASVWARCSEPAYRLARNIQAGVIELHASGKPSSPGGFGAYFEPQKQSGYGLDGGLPGLLAYTTVQSVAFNT